MVPVPPIGGLSSGMAALDVAKEGASPCVPRRVAWRQSCATLTPGGCILPMEWAVVLPPLGPQQARPPIPPPRAQQPAWVLPGLLEGSGEE